MGVKKRVLSNAEIANRLAGLAQLLSAQKENPYKIKAYQRAAHSIRNLSDSVHDLVESGADLTAFAGIGKAIDSAVREIALTGTLGKLEQLRSQSSSELISINEYPRLDPKRVLRIYKKLAISSVDDLRKASEAGEIERIFGARSAQHVRQGLIETHAILLYKAHDLRLAVEEYLLRKGRVGRVEAVGDYRRRVEVIGELAFIVETSDFPALVRQVERYGGQTPLLRSTENSALFALSAGVVLRIDASTKKRWGTASIRCTGNEAHLRKLTAVTGTRFLQANALFDTEMAFYTRFELSYIEPELREGHDEVERALNGNLPVLVNETDIRGDLHAHSTSSDGSNSIEQMADAAHKRGYEYVGITDHSQSLKIAGGMAVDDLWKQIRLIDRLNNQEIGIRILKSAEVDILADGTLDYPDELLRELDYTVCSIHSRFGLGKEQQTERILRAMDNRSFNILGHATGRLLLKRPGYELDIDRIIAHAKQNNCFFEINSSPDRLDLSAENARLANMAGVKISISTDAHSTREFQTIRYGIDQARRAGLEKASILNCLSLTVLAKLLKR
jgi:DNA polymerase (family 10)